MTRLIVGVVVLLAGPVLSMAQGDTYNVLHNFSGSFSGSSSDGDGPEGCSLTLNGSTLYGMTNRGGNYYNYGTIFKIGTDGSGYGLLHSFGSGSDGAYPRGDLTLNGSILYGMTSAGGNNGYGTIFKIGTNGTDYGIVHTFFGSPDAQSPYGSLTINGLTLYGTTESGGPSGGGTIFKVGTDGSSYNILRSFSGGGGDGTWPMGTLTLNGSTLYGTTFASGPGYGKLFQISTDDSAFDYLHSFSGYPIDGAYPRGSLTLSGSKLYGMTYQGGSNNGGTVFSFDTDTHILTTLHPFAGGSDDGIFPYGSLTLSGNTLYGMTSSGGSNNDGTIFSINTDGSEFSLLHSFLGGSDGASPLGSLTMNESTLYGMTATGGSYGYGVIFSMTVPEPSTIVLLGVGAISLAALAWRRRSAA